MLVMGLDELSADISKAYEDLKSIEDSIVTLSGKESKQGPHGDMRNRSRFGTNRRRATDGSGRLDNFGYERRDSRIVSVGSVGANKRRLVVSAENDLYEGSNKRSRNEDRDDEVRRTVQSSIVMPTIETKSRDAAISEIKGSEKKEVNVRNRRMFSNLLLGTLQRFQKDERKISSVEKVQAEKQKEVERRLKETDAEERERLARERAALLEKRREKERLIKSLQRKKAIIQYAEQKQEHYRKLQNFIQTQAKPPIFYLPSKHTLRTLELLKISTKKIDDLIKHRRQQMEADLKSPDEDKTSEDARISADDDAQMQVHSEVAKSDNNVSADANKDYDKEMAVDSVQVEDDGPAKDGEIESENVESQKAEEDVEMEEEQAAGKNHSDSEPEIADQE